MERSTGSPSKCEPPLCTKPRRNQRSQLKQMEAAERGLSGAGNSHFMQEKAARRFSPAARENHKACYCAAAEPATCRTNCVPLSSLTLFLAELITEPWALPATAGFSTMPC